MSDLPFVRLRPLIEPDADLIEAGHTQLDDPYNWAGFRPPGWIRAAVADRTTVAATAGQLAVVDADDVLLGDVGYRVVQTGATTASFCYAIGISLLPAHRGRGYGAAAQRELALYLFSTTVAQRVEADTDVDNVPERRSLERAGFTFEGIRRGYQWRDGAWRDSTIYAVLRGEL